MTTRPPSEDPERGQLPHLLRCAVSLAADITRQVLRHIVMTVLRARRLAVPVFAAAALLGTALPALATNAGSYSGVATSGCDVVWNAKTVMIHGSDWPEKYRPNLEALKAALAEAGWWKEFEAGASEIWLAPSVLPPK